MVNVEMPVWASYVSGINVVLFALPAFWASAMWLGRRDAIVLFALLGLLALIVETAAILTGFPYGHFGYSDLLGFRLFGHTPWTVALAWTPLVLAAYCVAANVSGHIVTRISLIAILLAVFDIVLDPGAVRLGFWRYAEAGEFYGVPASNFLGWLFSGALAAILIEAFVWWRKPLLPVPVQLITSAFFIIFFWTSLAFFAGMPAPALIGSAVVIALSAFYFRYYYAFDDMIVLVDENDIPIGTAPKLPAHNSDTRRHRAFSVFLFNGQGELLLQQRALTKKTWPGVWSNSCCGHLMLHESVERAARRRVKYELGITGLSLASVPPDFRYRAEKDGVVENELCPVLVGFTDKTAKPNPDEVASTRWVDWETFAIEAADPANGYSPWAIEEAELLNSNPQFTDLLWRKIVRNGG